MWLRRKIPFLNGFSQPRFRNLLVSIRKGRVQGSHNASAAVKGRFSFYLSPKMSIQAVSAVMDLQLPTRAKFVLVCIANYADDYFTSFPSVGALVRDTCIPERTLQRTIKWLQENNYLTTYWDYAPSDKLRAKPIRFFRLNFTGKPLVIKPNLSNCPTALRKEVVIKFNLTCSYCNKKGTGTRGPDGKAWQIDRIIPGSKGGGYTSGNVTLSCEDCNRRKGAKSAPSFCGANPDSLDARNGTPVVPIRTEIMSEMAPNTSVFKPSIDPSGDPPYGGAAFIEALEAFEASRKEMRKPLTTDARGLLYRKLRAWGEEKATQALEDSVINRWQGVFEPRTNGKEHNNGSHSIRSGANSSANERRAASFRGMLSVVEELRGEGGGTTNEDVRRKPIKT